MSEEILKRYKIKAKKSLGQNFLVNDEIIENIANIIDIKDKNIIEVGPGYGALTQKLLEKNIKTLTLIELDLDMIKIIQDRIELKELNIENKKIEIKNIDVLKFIPEFDEKYSVIANIPYYITSPILRHFLYDLKSKPQEMLILMQKDVGEKILNTFNEKKIKSSVIGLMMAKKSFVSEEIFVSKQNFVPAPKVESSVLKFILHNKFDYINDEKFLKIIKIGFSSTRKKLLKNLVNGGFKKEKILEIFKKLEIDINSRPENLSIQKWCNLVEEII